MSARRVPAALVALVGLAACASPAPVATTGAPAPGAAASASVVTTPGPSVAPTAEPTGTATTSPAATASGIMTARTTSAPPVTTSVSAGPSVPAVAARDVSAWRKADFASPSGRIWCGLTAEDALCHFPRGFWGTIPSGEEVCPGEGLDVTGVAVTASGTTYFCSGDPSAFPVRGQDSVAWHTATGYPWVAYDGFTLAVLPYGKALRHGAFVCASAENGVTCAHRTTGRGFRIALAGVDFF